MINKNEIVPGFRFRFNGFNMEVDSFKPKNKVYVFTYDEVYYKGELWSEEGIPFFRTIKISEIINNGFKYEQRKIQKTLENFLE